MTAAFWLQNLFFYSLQLLLVVLAGGALALLVPLRNRRVELGFLQGLLALCLLLPFAQPRQALVLAPSFETPLAAGGGSESPALEQAGDPETEAAFPPVAWLLVGGAGLRFGWLLVGFLRLARYRKNSRSVPLAFPFLPALQSQCGAQADTRVSDEVRGPVTFGWRRPVILLPGRFLEFEPDIQQAILCHELLHVARRDWLFTVVEESIRAVLWFHPAIWWLIGRIHLVREQFVDREVIRLTESRDPYLLALLTMAGQHLRPDLAPASLFLRKHHLDQRVAAVVRKESPMSRFRSVARLSFMAGLVGVVVGVAVSTFPLQAVPQQAPDYGAVPVVPRVTVFGPARGVVEQGGEKLLKEPVVAYSAEALRKGVEGRVVVELSLDEDGRVYDAMVISGPQELRRTCLISALWWQFSKNMPLPAKVVVTIRFELPRTGTPIEQFEKQPADPPPTRIRVGSTVQHARLVSQVTPEYPALARQTRVEGSVHLNVSINELGAVQRIEVAQGHPLLIPAAIEAVKQWEYRPTLLNGVPVGVETTVEVNFSQSRGVSAGASSRPPVPPPPPLQ